MNTRKAPYLINMNVKNYEVMPALPFIQFFLLQI
jgi:hypothetical protein